MIRLKTAEEIAILREGGQKLASILRQLKEKVRPGVTSADVDLFAGELFKEAGGTAAFHNYKPHGNKRAFPAYTCISVNDVIVHGIPTENPVTFKEGDIVTVDAGLKYKGLITDSAISFGVGKIKKEAQDLLYATREGLYAGIEAAHPGGTVGDIGEAVEKVAKRGGYGNARNLAGHGVGYEIHEEPYVPNTGKRGQGEELVPGLVIAIEPMFTLGTSNVSFSRDEFTVKTADGSLSAHFEHTVAITEEGVVILTEE